jgi:hypothetical protein
MPFPFARTARVIPRHVITAPAPGAATIPRVPRSAPRWHTVAVFAAIACNVVSVAGLRFFPYGDMPNHLARYSLISMSWLHTAPGWVQFRWVPTSYIAIDVIGAALVTVFGPIGASLALTIAYLALLPLGMFALLRAVNPRTAAWALVGSLMAFNWCFLTGFYSYSTGVGLSLLWLAWWWPRRASTKLGVRAVGVCGVAALYLVHMSAAAIVLAAVGSACIEPLLSGRYHTRKWHQVVARCATTMIYAAGPLLIYVLVRFQSAGIGRPSEAMLFRAPADKLRHFLTPFASFSPAQTIFFVSAYLLALWLRYRNERPSATNLTWMVAAGVMLAAYTIFPTLFIGAWDVDVRFLLPAYLLLFVLPATPETRPPNTAVVGLLFALVVAQAATTLWYGVRIDRETANVVRLLPTDGSNTLVLPTDEDEYFRVDPFTHVGEWATMKDANSRVNSLFAGGRGGAHLDHFIVERTLYEPGVHWARRGFTPLDWERVRADYQFILLTGSNPDGVARASEGAVTVAKNSSGRLLRIVGSNRGNSGSEYTFPSPPTILAWPRNLRGHASGAAAGVTRFGHASGASGVR